ncbi:MAG: mechanosensitive ion channel family protein [Polyangiales bacterium]
MGRPNRSSLASIYTFCAVALGCVGARAQGSKPDLEITDALENTGERIDVVSAKLAQLSDRALELLPLIGVALAVVLLSWLLARLLTGRDWLFRWIRNSFLRDLVRRFARIAIIGFGVLITLELLDATALVGATLGAAGVIGIAVGFAFRDIIENYLAGLLLSMRRPFSPNDFVAIDGDEGKVVLLTSRATVLLTLEGNHLRIPNAKVFKAVVLNYTRNPLRQLHFEVGVGVKQDLVEAQRIALETLAGMDAVLDQPPPFALIQQLGDSNVPIRFHAWVDQTSTDFFKARSEAIRLVKTAFDDANVEMPEPIYRVYMQQSVESPAQEIVRTEASAHEAGDTAADKRMDIQVQAERAAEGPDLLDEESPQE